MSLIKSNIDGVTTYQYPLRKDVDIVEIGASLRLRHRSITGGVYFESDPVFSSVDEAEEFLQSSNISPGYISPEDLEMICSMYGFSKTQCAHYTQYETYRGIKNSKGNQVQIKLKVYSDMSYTVDFYENYKRVQHKENIENSDSLVYLIEEFFNNHDIISAEYILCDSKYREDVILCASNSRKMSDNIVRVKSSNIWGYYLDIRNRKDKTGDLIVQFKGPNGGPGDIYLYFDFPVLLYRKWHTATSKGHFFWQYIRNNYKYRKLTGDKRGKLPNAVN